MSETIAHNPEVEPNNFHSEMRSFVESHLAGIEPGQRGDREVSYRVAGGLYVDQLTITRHFSKQGPKEGPFTVWSSWNITLGTSNELSAYNKGKVIQISSIDDGPEALLFVSMGEDGDFFKNSLKDEASFRAASELLNSVKQAMDAGQLQRTEQ